METKKRLPKRLLAILLTLCMLVMVCAPVFAYDFTFQFDRSQGKTLARSGPYAVESPGAYVKHNSVTVPTNYSLWLMIGQDYNVGADKVVSNEIRNYSSTIKQLFNYHSGYGGNGESYYLSAYPTNMTNFNPYTAAGTWAP